jgi:hypothetical protein
MIWVFKVADANGIFLAQDTLRVNKKKEFDEVMYRNMNKNYHRGTYGIDVPINGQEHVITIPLKKKVKPAAVYLTFIHKSQYWFPDSLGTVLTTKKYALQ